MHPAIRVCHFVSSTSRCWSRACMCCPRAVARSVGLVRRHRCPRTQTRSVTLGVRGSPAPWSAVRPVRASTLDISYVWRLFALADVYLACSTRRALPNVTDLPFGRGVGHAMRRVARCYVFYARYVLVLVFTRAWAGLARASGRQDPGTRRILSSSRLKHVRGILRLPPRSAESRPRGAGESVARCRARVTFRLTFCDR